MRSLRKTLLLAILASVLLVLALLHSWPTRAYTAVDVWQHQGHLQERLPEADPRLSNISFHVRDHVARYTGARSEQSRDASERALTPSRPSVCSLLARNGCVCEGEGGGVNLPFAQLLFPRVSVLPLHTAFNASELEDIKKRRAKEYQSFQKR